MGKRQGREEARDISLPNRAKLLDSFILIMHSTRVLIIHTVGVTLILQNFDHRNRKVLWRLVEKMIASQFRTCHCRTLGIEIQRHFNLIKANEMQSLSFITTHHTTCRARNGSFHALCCLKTSNAPVDKGLKIWGNWIPCRSWKLLAFWTLFSNQFESIYPKSKQIEEKLCWRATNNFVNRYEWVVAFVDEGLRVK